MLKIMLTAGEMDQVKQLLADKTGGGYANKINAIKVVRDASMHRKIDEFTGKERGGVGVVHVGSGAGRLPPDLR